MSVGRTVRLYLADGHPAGLIIAEILNWTGKVLSFPRGLLPQILKTRPEVSKTGVYFLVGTDPDNPFRSIVYVGESDDVCKRLISHDRDESKSFFEQVALVVSKDENLTKGHVRYLESKLIEIIRQMGTAALKNGNQGQPVSLPESDQADMEYFLQQIRVILPVVGLTFLQELPKQTVSLKETSINTLFGTEDGIGQDEPMFELSFLNGMIIADAYEAEGQFILKAGSLIRSPEAATSCTSRSYWQRIEQAREQQIILPIEGQPDVYRLTQDIVFKSPSGAGSFVCGTSVSGPWYWKVKGTDQTYADWREKRLNDTLAENTRESIEA